MIDWGNEEKPRPHVGGRVGIDDVLKVARGGDLRAVRAHLKREPSLLNDKTGGHNRTFLWEAVRGNQPAVVKYLLKAGADPNVPGRVRSEITVLLKPYCIARRYNRTALAELLIEAGTTVDIYSACFLGDEDGVRRLLARDPELVTKEQDDDSVWRVTPLHFAVAGGHEQIAKQLIDRGALVRPYTRLLANTAVRMKYPSLLPLLLASGADRKLAAEWSCATPR
jgi:hypothetical protein